MIQIGWTVCNQEGKRVDSAEFIIKPDNFIIPTEASDVHGITTEKAIEEGVELDFVLNKFNEQVKACEFIVAHNISFDEKIIGAEFLRRSVDSDFEMTPKLCTMKASTDYCAIPGPYGYKWPKLSELHIKLFGLDFAGAHDAFADIEATERCFWEMKRLELI